MILAYVIAVLTLLLLLKVNAYIAVILAVLVIAAGIIIVTW